MRHFSSLVSLHSLCFNDLIIFYSSTSTLVEVELSIELVSEKLAIYTRDHVRVTHQNEW